MKFKITNTGCSDLVREIDTEYIEKLKKAGFRISETSYIGPCGDDDIRYNYYIEVNSIQDLMKIVLLTNHEIIITKNSTLEIYDDWRE